MSSQHLLTAQQFALKAGVSTSTVSKWLRNGKIQGLKQNGKWMIAAEQLSHVLPASDTGKPVGPADSDKPTPGVASKDERAADYSIEEFSAMTYLTCLGVERYLKEGRLSGIRDASGAWRVEAGNLVKQEIRHLLRK